MTLSISVNLKNNLNGAIKPILPVSVCWMSLCWVSWRFLNFFEKKVFKIKGFIFFSTNLKNLTSAKTRQFLHLRRHSTTRRSTTFGETTLLRDCWRETGLKRRRTKSAWAQYYKTFYGSNLQQECLSQTGFSNLVLRLRARSEPLQVKLLSGVPL